MISTKMDYRIKVQEANNDEESNQKEDDDDEGKGKERRRYDGYGTGSTLHSNNSSKTSDTEFLMNENRITISNDTATSTENDSVKPETTNDNNNNEMRLMDKTKRLRDRMIQKGMTYSGPDENGQDDGDNESDQSSEYDGKRINGNKSNTTKKRKRINKPCIVSNCNNRSRGKDGLCIRHGGGPRCLYEGCTSGARDSSYLCMHHGGGARCSHQSGCRKGAVGGIYCIKHGGGKRCLFDGCDKSAFKHFDYCTNHMKLVTSGKVDVKNKTEMSKIFCKDVEENREEKTDTKLKLKLEDNSDNSNIKAFKIINPGSSERNKNSHFSKHDEGNNTIIENTIKDHSTSMEAATETQVKVKNESGDYVTPRSTANTQSTNIASSSSSSLLQSVVDPRVHISPYNAPFAPIHLPRPIGIGYNPYPMYNFNGSPYFNPVQPVTVPAIIVHRQTPFGYMTSQDVYRPPS